ncbi:MAG TPA: FG-GAP repeat protein [Phycisphaerae bacterium]|nr:FG-GAP repeat protein [Phycisphaerae bacterium]
MNARVAIALVAAILVSFGPRPMVHPCRADDHVPDSLSASDWSGIRAAFEANRHAAFAVEGGYQVRNPGQAWQTRFDGRGFLTTPDAGGWTWGLELIRYGVEREEQLLVTPSCDEVRGGRINYQWNEALTEWYVNDPRGLEHGYTVHCRSTSSAGPLHFILAVRGSLYPRVSYDGRAVSFVDATGAAVVNYSGLTVFDADGAAVPAWFELAAEGLRLNVDDRAARYPLTIDPIAQQAYLKASNTGGGDQFGYSVAASGNTIVVGAPFEDSNASGVNGNQADESLGSSGAAYVFVRSGGSWSQQAYLKASNPTSFDYFGISVAVSGDTIVVGAEQEDSGATGIDGNQADNSEPNSGAAYVFVRSGTAWSQQAYLKASNTDGFDSFGSAVAVSGDTVVVGAKQEDSSATGVDGNQASNSAVQAGAAYVFVRDGGIWSQQAYLKASNTGVSDFFGVSLAVSGDTVVVGASQEDSAATGVDGDQLDNSAADSGAAYVFVRDGGVWSQQAYLKASNTGAGDFMGGSVAVSGDTVVVGADQEDSAATGVDGNQVDESSADSGAAYVFFRDGGVWSQQAYLKASNTGTGDLFGIALSISGDTLTIGANEEDSNATGIDGNQADNTATNAGAAYLFARSGATWSQQAYVKVSNTGAGDKLGTSVAVSGNIVVIGADLEDSLATGVNGTQCIGGAADSGAVYVFPLESDFDGDGVPDATDICPLIEDAGQEDSDNDGAGDACDICPGTPAGRPVCTNGQPLRDCNGDCTVDAGDIQCLVDEILSP